MDNIHAASNQTARMIAGQPEDRRTPNGQPPKWWLTLLSVVLSSLIGGMGGVGGAWLALQYDNILQNERIEKLQQNMQQLDQYLRQHQTDGGIHYYHRRAP